MIEVLDFRQPRYTRRNQASPATVVELAGGSLVTVHRLFAVLTRPDRYRMFHRLATAVLAALLPVSAMAQVGVPSATLSYPLVDQLLSPSYLPTADALVSAPSIPVWASPDGRLLALVSLSQDEGAPILPRAPLMGSGADWRIIDATNLVSGGLRWRLAGGFSTDVSLAQSHLGRQCGVAGPLCYNSGSGSLVQNSATLGLGWSSLDQNASYSYGMSWLKGASSASPMPFSPQLGGSLTPWASMASPYGVSQAVTSFARGQFTLDSGASIELAATHGNAQLLPFSLSGLSGGSLSLDQSALSFGVNQGALRGTIIGRVMDSVGSVLPGRRWTLLDIGLSWRTPWQGELSVGTQSYLAPQAEHPKQSADIAPSRVPYVQYRQDL